MKTKFPYHFLMINLVLTLFSCTGELLQTGQETFQNPGRNSVWQLRYTDFKNESPNLSGNLKLNPEKNNTRQEQAKTFVINDFSVDAEYVYVSGHRDGKKTYTFALEKTEKSGYLENYVLNEQDGGIFDAYLIRYDSAIVNNQSRIGNTEVPKHIRMEYLGQIPDRPSVQKAMYCPQVPFQEYIWVPGVCSSNAHHETGDPACLCGTPGHTECTPADKGFYIIQYTLLPTDCGSGGATPEMVREPAPLLPDRTARTAAEEYPISIRRAQKLQIFFCSRDFQINIMK